MLVELALTGVIVIIIVVLFMAGVLSIRMGYVTFEDAGSAFSKVTDQAIGIVVTLFGVAVILLDVAVIGSVFGI